MAVLISTITKKKNNYQMKLDQANSAMAGMKLPQNLQEDIVDYMSQTMNTRD